MTAPTRDAIARHHRPWTTDDASVVRAEFGKRPLSDLAAELGRTPAAVNAYARVVLGLSLGKLTPAPKAKRPWTQEEEDAIRETYGTVATRTLAKRLGRSVTAVIVRKKRIGIAMYHNVWNSREVARLFGVDSHRVTSWIHAGLMRGKQVGKWGPYRQWSIDPDSVETFIRRHPEAYDRKRIEEGFHRNVAEEVWRADPLLTIPELALRHRVSRHCVRHAIETGRLPAKRGHGPNAPWYVRTSDAATFKPVRPELVGHRGRNWKERAA